VIIHILSIVDLRSKTNVIIEYTPIIHTGGHRRDFARQAAYSKDMSPTWQHVAQVYARELDKRVLVFAKSLGIACGISSYTYNLFGDMTGVAFARTWSEVFVYARIFNLEVLHIQHEHGLHWDDNEFLQTLYAFQKQHPHVSLFITMHSLNLGQQDRLTFYHRLAKIAHLVTLNKLAHHKIMQEMAQIHFIEHGIPTHFRAPPSRILRQNHVASFGFWDEQKRHDEVCDIAQDAGVAFDLFSQPPSEFGLAGCEGLVTYYRKFLDTPKLMTRLSQYSALVFFRRPAHEIFAVSGSARMALTANVPVICEDSMHFQDLGDAVDLVPFAQIPRRIRQVLANKTLRDELVARQNAFVSRWSEEATQDMHVQLWESLKPFPIVNDNSSIHSSQQSEIKAGKESRLFTNKMNTFASSRLEALPDEGKVLENNPNREKGRKSEL